MKFKLIDNSKVCFKAPFLNICLTTISVKNAANIEFESLMLNFIRSEFECQALYKYRNRTSISENGENKGTYEQKSFGPYDSTEIRQSDFVEVESKTILSKFASIQPRFNEINSSFINCYQSDKIRAEILIQEFSKTSTKFSLLPKNAEEIVNNGFDMNIYSCFFGQINENVFKILTFDDE